MNARALTLTLSLSLLQGEAMAAPCGTPECFERALEVLYADGTPSAAARTAALPTMKAACDAGTPGGCHIAGVILLEGVGATADPAAGWALVQRACEGGVPESCAAVVARDLQAASTPSAVVDATRAAFAACERESKVVGLPSAPSCEVFAGSVERLDPAAPGHLELARELLDKTGDRGTIRSVYWSASNGRELQAHLRATLTRTVCAGRDVLALDAVAPACLELARILRTDVERGARGFARSFPPDVTAATAAAIESDLCRRGEARGCLAEAIALSHASSITPNHVGGTATAIALCAQGRRDGCFLVHDWYRRCDPTKPVVGGDVPCDPAAAKATWAARCDGGDKLSCDVASWIDRLVTDRARDLAGLKKACVGGDLAACTGAGGLMPWGPERLAFFDAACAKGNQTACLNGAMARALGEGVPVDAARARATGRALCLEREYVTACDMFCPMYPGTCDP
jgi:hypothetical protein